MTTRAEEGAAHTGVKRGGHRRRTLEQRTHNRRTLNRRSRERQVDGQSPGGPHAPRRAALARTRRPRERSRPGTWRAVAGALFEHRICWPAPSKQPPRRPPHAPGQPTHRTGHIWPPTNVLGPDSKLPPNGTAGPIVRSSRGPRGRRRGPAARRAERFPVLGEERRWHPGRRRPSMAPSHLWSYSNRRPAQSRCPMDLLTTSRSRPAASLPLLDPPASSASPVAGRAPASSPGADPSRGGHAPPARSHRRHGCPRHQRGPVVRWRPSGEPGAASARRRQRPWAVDQGRTRAGRSPRSQGSRRSRCQARTQGTPASRPGMGCDPWARVNEPDPALAAGPTRQCRPDRAVPTRPDVSLPNLADPAPRRSAESSGQCRPDRPGDPTAQCRPVRAGPGRAGPALPPGHPEEESDPSVTVNSSVSLPRCTVTFTSSPGCSDRMATMSAVALPTRSPSNPTMMSPSCIPA